MNLALIGSHGVGKTTTLARIKTLRPRYGYFKEGVRHQTRAFGFAKPFDVVQAYGIGPFELWNLNSYSVIDPELNPDIRRYEHVFVDRLGLDQYAYYLALRSHPEDYRLAPLLQAMVKHYVGLIDRFVYFPTGVFPLVGDDMRPDGMELHRQIDEGIRAGFDLFKIPPDRVHRLVSTTVEGRAEEILSLIPA